MNDVVIHAQGLGKRYRIRTSFSPAYRYRALRDTLADIVSAPVRRMRARFHPSGEHAPSGDGTVWALRDVSFEVRRGDVVGIIGRNGVGKTTLLKLLSRITEPTEGLAEIRGRVGSLLEVGTGIHPELTGRENIYLGGAILGMRKAEIDRKFDEIVSFAEVEDFLETPLKRYSSGMYVRLAFAVAAHLETDILLVDEVLAVGDAAFQKKCLGKMGNLATEGRTVLFVSHNMATVANLCERAILLDRGKVARIGLVTDIVQEYLASVDSSGSITLRDRSDRHGNGQLRITNISLEDEHGNPVDYLQSGRDALIILSYEAHSVSNLTNVKISISVANNWGHGVCVFQSDLVGSAFSEVKPDGKFVCSIPRVPLASGLYPFSVDVTVNGERADLVRDAGKIRVEVGDFFGHGKYPQPQDGPALIPHSWDLR